MASYGIPAEFGVAGAYLVTGGGAGKPTLRELLVAIMGSVVTRVATTAALEALTDDYRENGLVAQVLADDSLWRFNAASTASASGGVLVPDDAPTTGRWVRFLDAGSGASDALGASVASVAALAAIPAVDRADGQLLLVQADASLWYFESGSSAAAAAGLVVVPDAGTGRWLRVDKASVALSGSVADLTALKALAAASRYQGMLALVQADGSKWRFSSASVLGGDDLLVAAPAAGSGRWLRADSLVDLKLAESFATADAAVLYTVPAGFVLRPTVPFREVTTSWTGGTDSAIGLSSSNTFLSTKGDLLGGAGGDLAAGLVSTGPLAKGTIGTDIGKPGAVLVGGDTIRFDRIVDAFTAGAGFAHVPVEVLVAPGA